MCAERDLPRAFNRQPVWKRIAMLLAGPAFNLIFAIALYWVLFTAGVPALKPIIGEITPDSIAARAGLRYEDQILADRRQPTPTLEAATLAILEDLTDDGTINMRVRGVDGAERDLSLVGRRAQPRADPARSAAAGPGLRHLAAAGASRSSGSVNKGSAGERAGLQVGDEILAIDGQPIAHFQAAGQPRQAESGPHGRRWRCAATARFATCRSRSAKTRRAGRKIGLIGIAPKDQRIPTGRTLEDMLTLQKYGAAGGGRAGGGQDLGYLGVHAADRRPHHHRRRVAAGDFRADQYRGNNRFRRAAGLAHVPRARWR